VTPQHGTNQYTAVENDNVILHKQGNSKAYTLDRLKREAPALFQAVCAGELSCSLANRILA
jgi:hypothetical protein